MSDFRDKYVKCPFYISQDAKKIHCIGFIEGSYIHVAFPTKELKDAHTDRRCNCIFGYLKCPLYSAIAKTFGGDGN